VLKDDTEISAEDLQTALISSVRRDIGAFANFRRAIVVARLPKTRSGKILRQIIRKIADDADFEHPATIDDPDILEEIKMRFIEEQVGLVGGELSG
jgi:propionyl-CoA synthetase